MREALSSREAGVLVTLELAAGGVGLLCAKVVALFTVLKYLS